MVGGGNSIWFHLNSSDLFDFHSNSFDFNDFIWIHLISFEFIWCHLSSVDFIWFHFSSFGFTWFPLISCDFIWFHMNSLDFIWIHFFMMLTREKGIYAHKGKGKSRRGIREKGKSTTHDLPEISLDQAPRARTYARTARHETISRLRGGHAGLTPQPPIL